MQSREGSWGAASWRRPGHRLFETSSRGYSNLRVSTPSFSMCLPRTHRPSLDPATHDLINPTTSLLLFVLPWRSNGGGGRGPRPSKLIPPLGTHPTVTAPVTMMGVESGLAETGGHTLCPHPTDEGRWGQNPEDSHSPHLGHLIPPWSEL